MKFDNYGTRYRPDLDLVIKGIDCTISPGEKVRNFQINKFGLLERPSLKS